MCERKIRMYESEQESRVREFYEREQERIEIEQDLKDRLQSIYNWYLWAAILLFAGLWAAVGPGIAAVLTVVIFAVCRFCVSRTGFYTAVDDTRRFRTIAAYTACFLLIVVPAMLLGLGVVVSTLLPIAIWGVSFYLHCSADLKGQAMVGILNALEADRIRERQEMGFQ